ncbi:MAG TPA: FtsH protease activity modulator HflK [Candidatus Krumholzibacteria bacterium]|nr:FtsH protease activity modulator HflK [Candidatus Krumholzibacteria bacterium]
MTDPRQFDGSPQGPEIRFPQPNRRLVRNVLVGVAAVVVALTSFYTVDPEEVALVLRFGKFVRDAEPGLHFKLPFGIESIQKVPVQRQLKEEFGFRTVATTARSQFATRGFGEESNMLTGDLNAAVVEWVVQYRVVDPYKYTFRIRDPQGTFRSMTEAVMRTKVGDRTVNEVLTVGRAEVANEVQVALQELCDQYEIGISVDQVVLQDVDPPEAVKPSFNEVNEAQQEREKLINQAQSEYNKVIPRALGEAQQTIQEAEGYALKRINQARGDSARFVALYDEYRKAPEVTRKRIYLETMAEVLPQIEGKVIVDAELRSLLPLLNLDAPAAKAPTEGGAR